MTLFFVGYLIAVTSTIAFIVVILTPKWIYPNNLPVDANNLASPNERNYRGIFYVDEDSVDSCRPPYTVACASLAIIALSLSIILLWLAGGYLYIRRRRLMPIAVIWIVMITMNRDINLKNRCENIGFSTWITVGGSGGYLLTFISFTLY
ncbi:unnamed protein product [Rotaria socialis]|uniref:Uncharacterized protein n=2 Tax=Rotaria socialis TaxID=392032 RepID=A0A817SCJ1_9BILA|nr:unnamed protein product [Rotaria socialis]CAF3306897.1 unnamed protein product [Rotaria socialis]CAF3421779.1 unnamed protein product [Rotaria socialis]